jgi:hypothetical protein
MAGEEQLMTEGASIYVLVDALGWEILRNRPFLEGIIRRRERVETILGYSSGAIPTLLTGKLPNEHGHWNLFYRSPATSPFRWTAPLLLLPEPIRESRITRRLVKEVSRRLSGYTGYFAIYNLPLDRIRFFDICETSDIYEPGGLAPARSIFDLLTAARVPYECYNYHRHTDAQILDRVPGRLRESDCRTYFLYLSGLDSYLHFHISDRLGVDAKLRWYEERLRRIVESATASFGRVRLHIFSDHGMTPIQDTRDVMREVASLGLKIPEDYLPVYDSTMARFWVSEVAETRLRACLDSLPYGRLLSAAEVEKLGIRFEDGRYGHLVFVMKPGLLICPSDLGTVRFEGMHGFHPAEDPHSHAVYLSTEDVGLPVRHLTDVLPMLLADQGMLPAEAIAG